MISLTKLSRRELRNCLEEVRILNGIRHPQITKGIDSFLDHDSKILFVVTEFLGGGDLARVISRQRESGGFFSEDQIWSYALQILEGLAKLHRTRVIHRDIKPKNLFLSRDLKTIKIGDLNISKIQYTDTLSNSFAGTPNYLAPEIWNSQRYDYKCDVFSLGCVLFEMASLFPLFSGRSMGQLSKEIISGSFPMINAPYSKELKVLISCCLINRPSKRPSIDQLLNMKVIKERKRLYGLTQDWIDAEKGLEWSRCKFPKDVCDFAEIFQNWKQRKITLFRNKSQGRSNLFLKKKTQNYQSCMRIDKKSSILNKKFQSFRNQQKGLFKFIYKEADKSRQKKNKFEAIDPFDFKSNHVVKKNVLNFTRKIKKNDKLKCENIKKYVSLNPFQVNTLTKSNENKNDSIKMNNSKKMITKKLGEAEAGKKENVYIKKNKLIESRSVDYNKQFLQSLRKNVLNSRNLSSKKKEIEAKISINKTDSFFNFLKNNELNSCLNFSKKIVDFDEGVKEGLGNLSSFKVGFLRSNTSKYQIKPVIKSRKFFVINYSRDQVRSK